MRRGGWCVLIYSTQKEKKMTRIKKNIFQKIAILSLIPLCYGTYVVAQNNALTQEDQPTYGDMLPTCREQWLNDNFFVPNSNSFKEPWSPQLAAFAWEYCQLAHEIDKKAVNNFSQIDANRDKNLLELLHESSNFYCYGAYGDCGLKEDTLYQQYLDSCEIAFDTAQERLAEFDEDFTTNDPFFHNFRDHCTELSRQKLKTFRDIASIQIVKNQTKLVEESNLKKFLHNREQLSVASDIERDLWRQLSDGAVNFSGYNTYHDEAAGHTRNQPYDTISNSNVNKAGPKERDVYKGSNTIYLTIPPTRE